MIVDPRNLIHKTYQWTVTPKIFSLKITHYAALQLSKWSITFYDKKWHYYAIDHEVTKKNVDCSIRVYRTAHALSMVLDHDNLDFA